MRSRDTGGPIGRVLVACALVAWALPAQGAADERARAAPPPDRAISAAALDGAIQDLKRDPNIGGQSKVRTLKWTKPSQPTTPIESPSWILGFLDYVSQVSGLLLWVAGAVGVAVAAVWIYRHFGSRLPRAAPADELPAAARVLDLDISPDSLPGDVGAAALALSRSGQVRAALSLLYRACLSQAVNRFGALIGPSSTEREALRVVRASLDESRARYVAEVVRMWQRAVYAGDAVAHEEVAPLCSRFGEALDEVRT